MPLDISYPNLSTLRTMYNQIYDLLIQSIKKLSTKKAIPVVTLQGGSNGEHIYQQVVKAQSEEELQLKISKNNNTRFYNKTLFPTGMYTSKTLSAIFAQELGTDETDLHNDHWILSNITKAAHWVGKITKVKPLFSIYLTDQEYNTQEDSYTFSIDEAVENELSDTRSDNRALVTNTALENLTIKIIDILLLFISSKKNYKKLYLGPSPSSKA